MEILNLGTKLFCIQMFYLSGRIGAKQTKEALEQSLEDKSADCGGVFNIVLGKIVHPLSSERYGNNELCYWSIDVRIPLFFYFSKFSTETHYDNVTARDGPTIGSPEIGRFSGKTLTEVTQTFTTKGAAVIIFTSDENVIGKGFILHWRPYTTEEQCKDMNGICIKSGDKCDGTINILENSCLDRCVCCEVKLGKALNTTIGTTKENPATAAAFIAGNELVTGATLNAINSLLSHYHRTYSRWMEMRIENHSQWNLGRPEGFLWWGHISDPPVVTGACTNSVFSAHKNSGTATGTTGIVIYWIKDAHIIFYWSVSYSGYCNALGLGIYRDLLRTGMPREDNKYDFFYQFYTYHDDYEQHASNASQTIVYREYCSSVNHICTTNLDLMVCGIMSTTSGAKAYVSVEDQGNEKPCS